MGEFQKRTQKFTHKGMNWNRSVDTIPDGQICYGRNIRSYEEGTITQRNGVTVFSNLGGTFTHSIARLNNFDATLVNFDYTYVIGQDTKLFVGKTNTILTNAAQNPVKLPPSGATTSFSGNPMTMVDMAPVGSPVGWKYIGDSSLMVKVGYYPGDDPATGTMARALTVGMTPPVNTVIPTSGGAGPLVGDYQWIFAYRNKFTGDRSNPSSATRVTQSAPALTMASNYATMTLPTTPLDPQTGAADAHILIDVYRFGGVIQDWRFVGTGTSGATFNDDLADADILNNPTPPQTTDPVTGLTRFNVFRPFITQDAARYSTTNGTMTQAGGTGIWTITVGGTETFNVNWLPGSFISINNNLWTIYQVRSTTVIEIVEDATGNLVSGNTYPWATVTGTLLAGQPLPHIWGPFGTGSSGAYIFGCGDPNSAGTLFWTNGNDPDSTDVVNSLVVTSPSEPLRAGCVYDGTPYVWSTERIFRIYPSMTVGGQFTTQEIAGGKGILAEWSLTVQSNGVSDQSVSWVGKDGVYDLSNSGGIVSLTDRDLMPFFPHDGNPGIDVNTIYPFISTPDSVGAPSFTSANMKYHRLCWFQNELFYDFVGVVSASNVYSTLVYDNKNVKGWVSLDKFDLNVNLSNKPICRGIEIADNALKLGVGGRVCTYTGTNDDGTSFNARLITRADDLGDPRAQKVYGDLVLDINPGGNSTTSSVLTNFMADGAGAVNSSAAARTNLFIDSYQNYPTQAFARNIGLDITWPISSGVTTLYQWIYTYVTKPEITLDRPTDKTDDGYAGAKYLRGFTLETNTLNVLRKFKVFVDGTSVTSTPLSVTANGQLELPFAITPAVGSEFQIVPDSVADTSTVGWEIFQVRWVWEKWPDLTATFSAWMSPLQTVKPKYIRGFTMPVDTMGVSTTFKLAYDSSATPFTLPAVNTTSNRKTPVPFTLIPPIVAHEVQLQPQSTVRYWPEEIVWDAEEWPEIVTELYPFQSLGTAEAKYLRSLEVPVETGGLASVLNVRSDAGSFEIFPAVATPSLIKTVFPFVPTVPLIGHEFQLISTTPMRVWFAEAKWDFEVWPELSAVRSPWINCGDPGVKFIQGFVAPLDTNGAPVSFTIVYDGGNTVTVGPATTTAAMKSPVPFSFATPIIAHELQIIPSAKCRIWYDEIKWIWEPMPELVYSWITQETNHDIAGYHFMGPQSFIAYIGGNDSPVFTVTTQYGSQVYSLPASNGAYVRAQIPMLPQKAKWRKYSLTSTQGVRVYLRDTSIAVQPWGSDKAFLSVQPFGEISRAVGARI